MIIMDKRKKCITPLKDVADGMVFEDMSGTLFMKISLGASCYPSGSNYDTTDVAVDLDEFGVCFFDNTTEVCVVNNAELVLS